MSFEEFMKRCDDICSLRIGLGIYNLEDWNWADAHEADYTPTEAVDEFLEDIGADF